MLSSANMYAFTSHWAMYIRKFDDNNNNNETINDQITNTNSTKEKSTSKSRKYIVYKFFFSLLILNIDFLLDQSRKII